MIKLLSFVPLALAYSAALYGDAITTQPEFWREGPVTIEAQLYPPRAAPTSGVIIYVDAQGVIWHGGQRAENLTREELLEVLADLAAYEVAISSPPPRRFRK